MSSFQKKGYVRRSAINNFKGLRNNQQKKSERYLSTAKSMQKLRLSMHYFPINIKVFLGVRLHKNTQTWHVPKHWCPKIQEKQININQVPN